MIFRQVCICFVVVAYVLWLSQKVVGRPPEFGGAEQRRPTTYCRISPFAPLRSEPDLRKSTVNLLLGQPLLVRQRLFIMATEGVRPTRMERQGCDL